jgi:ATP-binding cassette subfamily F protein uup
VAKSGGLALLKVLMANPNVVCWTNQPTISIFQTLNAKENTLLEDFYGTLLIVSHDRSFLDKTVSNIWSFDGKGNIKEYPGNYSDYLEKKEQEQKQKKIDARENDTQGKTKYSNPNQKKKLSYIEEREFKKLEKEIQEIENKLNELNEKIHSGAVSDYRELENIGIKITELEQVLDQKTSDGSKLGEKQGRGNQFTIRRTRPMMKKSMLHLMYTLETNYQAYF